MELFRDQDWPKAGGVKGGNLVAQGDVGLRVRPVVPVRRRSRGRERKTRWG